MSAILDHTGLPMLAANDAAPARRGQTARPPRMRNMVTGAGGGTDKSLASEFIPVRLTRSEAETLYQMSWAAARLVDCIVDDMFAAGRRWTGEDESANEAMEEAEAELMLWERLPSAIKAGRIFGTGMLVVCPADGQFEQPLIPEDVKEGGIANLVSVDRWSLNIATWQREATRPRYGLPYQYRWSTRVSGLPGPEGEPLGAETTSQNILVNTDRLFRFDGQASPLTEGWTSGPWERQWGVSILTRAIEDLMRDASMRAASGQLVSEASVWVQKVNNFRETLARGKVEPGDVSVDELAEQQTLLRSIYRTHFMDALDEAERIDVTWAGLADVLNGQSAYLAAIGGIPKTRFLGSSATGLNATGDGEARDWRISVEALRRRTIDPILQRRLDIMIARHAGLAEPPPYEWNALGEMTDLEEAQVLKTRTEATLLPLAAGAIDEEEVRERLSQDEWWGEFGEWTPPEPEFDESALLGSAPPTKDVK